MTTTNPNQIVFIDSRVPDIQDLLNGLAPGEHAFVIDPSSDGLQQIANILAAQNLMNLASISIVSHGETGELELGSSFITDANLGVHSNALAEIGASLAPGGTIQLYGCDVAQGPTGQQFINDFSTFTGGAPVEAATHLVGSAAQGGSWTLDAASSPSPGSSAASAATPAFTSAALANFQGVLTAPVQTEVWITATGGGNDDSLVHVDDTGSGSGSNSVTLFNETSANNPSTLAQLTDVALDTTGNLYFLVEDQSGAPNNNIIYKGTLSPELSNPLGTPTLTSIYSQGGGLTVTGKITGIALDTANQQVYFTQQHSLEKVSYNGGTPTTLATGGVNVFLDGLALDLPHNQAFFFSETTHSVLTPTNGTHTVTTVGTNAIYVDSDLTTTTTPTKITLSPADSTLGANNFPVSLGEIAGIAVDTATEKLYFTTKPITDPITHTTGSGGIYEYDLTGNPSHTYSAIWLEPPTGSLFFSDIKIDDATNRYYVTSNQAADANPSVYDGALSGGTTAQSPTLFANLAMSGITQQTQGLAIDNAPSLSVTPVVGATWTEEQVSPSTVPLITSATASDTDNTAVASATVSISGGTFFTGDTLSFTNNNNITGSYNSATGVLVLSGVDSFANYQTALDSVHYNGGENPTSFGTDNSRTLVWSVNDGLLTSAPSTTTVSVIGVNDPPTLNVAPSAHFTEEGGPVTLSPALSVVDVDDRNLSSATVSITGGRFTNDGDVLSATAAGGITVSYDSSTETLTLTGTDTLARYQSVLDSVTFTAGENPTNFGSNTTRTLTWVAMDPSGTANGGTNVSTLSTTTISITNVNDPPTLSNVATSASWTEEGPVTTLSNAVSITDPDSLKLASATVSIAGGGFAGDVLAASTVGFPSITASYNSTTETLTLTGSDTLADYQTVLDSVTFNAGENPTDFGLNPTRTITWVLNDGSGSNNLSTAATTTVSITNVNDPPTLSNVAGNASFTEEGGAVLLSSALSVTDPDSANLASATVSITGGKFTGDGDVLSATATGSITVSYDSTNERLILSGSDTVAHYQTVLDSVAFNAGENPTNFGANPTRTVTWQVDDGSGSFNRSNVGTTTVSITNVNDPPTLSNVATSASWTEEGTATTLSGALSVTDPDDQTLASATVSVTGGGFAGDVLSATPTGGIGVSYDSTNERLILTGSDTLANYQTVLDGVTFHAGENPTNFGANTTRTVTWVLNDGSSSNSLSTAVTSTISITNVNDPPTLSNVVTLTTVTAQTTATLSPGLVVTDPDNQKLASATVSITGGRFAGDGDVLSATATGSITVSYDTTNERLILSGSDTLANYQTVLNSVTFDPNILDPTNSGLNPTRTVTWVLNDGGSSNNFSTVQTETVSVPPADIPPTLSNVAASAAWTEESAATTLSPSITVSDPDGVNTDNSATVSITGGTFAGDGDVLAATTTSTSITASYNSTTETLTLTGSDTLAHYQQVLDSVTFNAGENPTNFGLNPTRTLTWVVADHLNVLSTAQTETVSITNVNDPPTLSNVATSATFTEHGAAVTLSGGLSVTDPDNQKLASATVSITGGTFAGDGDVLSATGNGTIIASYDSANERLILSGSDTLANYQSVLDSVIFSAGENPTNFGANPTRTVSWVLNDGSSSFAQSTAVTSTVSITNVNDPPTLSNVATNASFTEEGGAVTLSNAVSVTDPDNQKLASATVSITGGTFTNDGDVLSATGNGTITVSYDSANERLILSGSDTLANYQSVLDGVTFNAGENPTNFGANPTRTVTWVLNDGSSSNSLSTAVTSTVSITNVNDPPTLSNVATSAHFTEHGAAVTLSGGLSVTDPDNQKLTSATVSITGGSFAGDVLAATGNGTIVVSYDSANERLILSGSDTLANYQTVLDSVTFSDGENPTNFGANPTRTVTWVLDDGSGSFNRSTAVTSTISITNVNDPPTLSNVATSAQFTEAAGAVTLSNAVSISDADDVALTSATVSIGGGTFAGDGDVLSASTAGFPNITASYNSTTETLTLTGSDTLADYQSVLDRVTFNSTSLNPDNFGSTPTRTISWVLNDGGTSNNLSTPLTTTVSITAVNNPPTLSNVATSAHFTAGPVTLSGAASVSDPDNLKLASATVSISGGTFANDGDVLAATTVGFPSITASYDSTAERLILTGSDTLADYQSVLDQVTFNSTNINPTNFGANPTRTVTWVLDDGSSTSHFSAAATTTLNVNPVNIPPTLSNVATSAHFTEAAGAVTLSSAVSVSDPDDLKLASATVSVSGGTFANDGDMLAVSTAGFPNITASYNSMTETLTLTGSDTLADYQSVLDKVTFNSTSLNPTNFGSNPSRLVSWLLNDGGSSNSLSTPVTTTVGITAVNNPPALAGVAASLSVTVANAAILSSAVTVSDPDDLTLAHATVSVSGGSGDTLATSTAGTSIAASYNSSTETLTLTGADTLAHYQSVLDQVTFTGTAVGMRTVSWVLDDGHTSNNLSTAQTEMLSIVQPADQNLFGMVTHDVTSPGGDIYALYETILGRAPDALGYEFWTAQLEGGAPLTLIAQDFLASPEYTSKFGPFTQSSDSSFVDQLYQNGLHRHAEPNGLAYWDTQLANGANSRPQTAVDIALSQESQNDLAPVFQAGVFVPSQADAEIARLFYGVLGRAPDPNGLAYWENDFAQGDSLTKIASDFLNSAEYTQNFGTPNNTQFVNALYEGALGRSSDPMGGQYWINSLDQGASRASVAVNIAESPEAMSHLSSQIEAGFKIV
ncbi:protein of unknown function [Rhizobiales bacterium GAS188]|nr:protein of unknown function [Rhizobiales bacterium GAS188]